MENKKRNVSQKRFTVALSTAEALGWAGLLVFICGWFFILGILVGRGLVPVPGHRESFEEFVTRSKQFTAAGPAVSAEPRAPETPDVPVPIKTLGTSKAAPPAATDQAAPPAKNASPVPDKPLKTPAVEKKVTATVAAAPVAEKQAAKPGATAPDQAGNKIFTIQIAALRESGAADKMVETLKKKNYVPYLEKATLADNVVWYRLRCGAFASHDEAAPVLERLRKDGYSPILVRR